MDELDGVDVASYPTVGTALCGLLEWLTAPAYATISPSHHLLNTPTTTKPTSPLTKPKLDAPNAADGAAADGAAADGEGEEAALKQATTAAGAVLAALPLLTRLGSHLHRRPLLLARMCRLCRAALEAAPTDDRLSDAVDGCIDAALLPALTLSTPNPGLVHELWLLLEVRPYTSRYRSYGVLHARMKDEAWPELYACRAKTADDTKRMMRRLSKENTKQYGRHLGKLRVRVRVGLDPPR